jgi:hypothetical protein
MPPWITKESHRPRVSNRTMSYRLSERITVRLVCFKKRMAPSRQSNGTTGEKKNLTVSFDETKQRLPEQDHSPITSARSNNWAECRNKKVSAPSRRRDMSLDIPFYMTSPVSALTRQVHGPYAQGGWSNRIGAGECCLER